MLSGKRHKRGSIIVDAAVCLPLFIMAVSVLMMLIAQTGMEETIFSAVAKGSESFRTAHAAFSEDDRACAAGSAAFLASYGMFIRDEWPDGGNAGIAWVSEDVRAEEEAIADHVMRADSSFRNRLPFSLFTDDPGVALCLVFRPFCGESFTSGADSGDEYVYVFPKRGERYHYEGCRILQEDASRRILTASFRRYARPCTNCDPQELPDGAAVYVFASEGSAYHRKSCAAVTKAYEKVKKSEAVAAGYTACYYCAR